MLKTSSEKCPYDNNIDYKIFWHSIAITRFGRNQLMPIQGYPSGHIAASSEFSNRFFTSSSCKGAASSDYPQEGNAARSCASRCSCRITQPVPNSIATHIIPSGKETRKTTYGVGRELSCIIPLPIPIINHDYLQACPGDI